MRALHASPALLLASLLFAPLAAAQDTDLSTVVSRDSATQLVLTGESIVFHFTEQGAREIESNLAPRKSNWMDRMIQASVSGRMTFPLGDIRKARYADGALTLYFQSRPINAPEADRRGKFVYENVAAAEAQAFIREFERVKARRESEEPVSASPAERIRPGREGTRREHTRVWGRTEHQPLGSVPARLTDRCSGQRARHTSAWRQAFA
jgi:hypothetical protein